MGWYGDNLVPRITNVALAHKRTGEVRERVCSGLSGSVVELGFGSGLNAAFYPDGVDEVLAVEPSDVAWRMAEPRVAATTTGVRRVGLDGQSLPLADGSADSALSTWTLCTIPDAARALGEVRRVLKPGGRLHFVEHGRSPEDGVRKWQERLDPIQKRMAGGCHLSRPIEGLITDAGFTIEAMSNYFAPGAPKPFSWFYEGVASN